MTEQTIEQPQKNTVAQIFTKLMQQTAGFQDVKKKITDLTKLTQKLTYHAVTNNEEEYLQVYGLSYHEENGFNYINQLLHSRTTQVLDQISQNKIIVNSTIPLPPLPPPDITFQMAQQIQSVLNNIDLPISLFKRNDYYWSHDNPKTLQVKEYIKQLHEQDKKWKGDLKKKRQDILNQKNQQYHKTIEENAKQEQKVKEQEKIRMIKKIQFIKSQSDVRKRTIDDGLEFIKKQGRPLYKKMEEEFHNNVQLPTLQQKKKKLSQLRELRRSVDMVEISQHKQKYEKIKEEHEGVKITNEAVKVSYKGHFYKSLEKSTIREFGEQSRLKSLVDKRVQYAQMVKDNFKPAIDEEKANQITQRIEDMHKRFRRAKKLRKQKKQTNQDDEDDEDQQVEEEQPEPEPQVEEQEDEEDEDEDQFKIQKKKDDQYEPTNEERYKMGIKFLQQARRRRKKIQSQKQDAPDGQQDVRNKTFSVKDAMVSKITNPHQDTLIPSSIDSTRRVQYRNYLHEMSKTNKTIDFINTSQIKSDLTQDMKLKAKTKVESLQNKIRYVQEKAKQEEELLKHRKIKKNQVIGKKQQLDNAIIDTIKARLALMNN